MNAIRRTASVLALLIGLSLVAGCGGTGGRRDNQVSGALQLNGAEYLLLEPGDLAWNSRRVTGTGSLLFKDPLLSPDNNFSIEFALGPGGSVSVVGLSDKKLENGVTITVTRLASNKAKVQLQTATESYDLSGDFDNLNLSETTTVEIDIHAHGHVLFWVNGNKMEEEYVFTARPAGTLWGLLLKDASITQARVDKPKENEG